LHAKISNCQSCVVARAYIIILRCRNVGRQSINHHYYNCLYGKKAGEQQTTGGMEDFMTLIRVYFQAAIAAELGITNLSMLPDLRVFKTTLRVPTINNRLGVGEKARCRKMLKEIY